MNICFISTFPPTQCGIATYSSYLIDNLLKLDPKINITVLAETQTDIKKSNLNVISGFKRNEDYPITLLNLLKKIKPDIVHIQHEFGIFGKDERFIHLLEGIKSLNIKLILTLHTVYTQNNCFNEVFNCEAYQKRIGDLCDIMVMHLEFSMKKVLERIGVPSKKLKVIPHGTQHIVKIDQNTARDRLKLPRNAKILLSFGFVRRLKDELTIINSIPLIKKHVSSVLLYIAGNPQPNRKEDIDYLNSCKTKVKELGLEKDVLFSGDFIGEKDLPCVFSACDVCVFAYMDEFRSASGSFHLAIGAEKPVILSRIPKFEEEGIYNISDEIMILPQSPESFAKVAIRLLSDKKFYTYIKKRVKKYALKTSWENVAKQHLNTYALLFK